MNFLISQSKYIGDTQKDLSEKVLLSTQNMFRRINKKNKQRHMTAFALQPLVTTADMIC